MAKPSVRELSGVFFRIGNFTFGGGSATTAALQREIVDRRHWYDTLQFGLCYALARVTPGTNLFALLDRVGMAAAGLARRASRAPRRLYSELCVGLPRSRRV